MWKWEIICFEIERCGCRKWWCQFNDVFLTSKKARIREALGFLVGHSHTPSLVLSAKRIFPVQRSFTWKKKGKNSTETLLVLQNCKMEINFFFIIGTHKTSYRERDLVDVGKKKLNQYDIWINLYHLRSSFHLNPCMVHVERYYLSL